MERQQKADKNYDTLRKYDSISIGSTVVFQQKDRGPWSHGTIIDKSDHNHSDQSYRIQMTKTGQLITKKQQTYEGNYYHS